MTNINCSSSCIYQKEGKCCLEKVSAAMLQSSNENCVYFQKAEPANARINALKKDGNEQ